MLKGKKIVLTGVERRDLKQLMDWRNNPDFRKNFREYRELNMLMQEKWYNEKVLNDPSVIMFSIRDRKTDKLLGCCGLVYINWVHRHADLSFYIGVGDSYIDNKGYAQEACSMLFDYGFKELALNKIWTEIYVFDTKKKKLFEKLGLKIDGTLRENYFWGGKFWNSYVFSILSREWLKRGLKIK